MGMFDDVICEMHLPDGLDSAGCFQTKCFDRTLTQILITAEGELLIHRHDMEPTGRWYVYDFDRPFEDCTVWVDPPEDDKESDIFGEGPHQEFERTNDRWELLLFTGKFNFYGNAKDGWHEYVASVKNGHVDFIMTDRERSFRKRRASHER